MAKEAIQLKVEKVEKPKKERKQKELTLNEITPEPIKRVGKLAYLLVLIPVSLVVGIVEGICHGFQRSLEVALELYKKEMGK